MSKPRPEIAVALLLGAALLLGLHGIGRSLWLDEAWVANSIQAPSLAAMFSYSRWVQSTPPLFLLAVRGVTSALGVSNASLRIVPLLLALLAAAGLFAVAKRLVAPSLAVLACAVLVFFSAEVEYSHSVKQYSGEAAATALVLLAAVGYFQDPSPRRFYWLAGVIAVAMPLSYPTVFLLPGILLAVLCLDRRRALLLGAVCAVVLAILYVWFIRPNLAPELRVYWAWDRESGFSRGTAAALLAAAAMAVWAVLALFKGKRGAREWTAIMCLAPCLLVAASAALNWYPLSYRTRLFVLPCFLLVTMMYAQDLCGRSRLADVVALALVLVTAAVGIRTQLRAHPNLPKEDVDGAVGFLKKTVGANDLLLIHPSVEESFRFYAAMDGWHDAPGRFGDTGWPCCPRGKPLRPYASTAEEVERDEDRMVPAGFSGQVWMLYTIRPTHWDWVGFDESKRWRSHLADRGCIVSPPNRDFENLAISLAACGDSAK